MAAQLSQAAQRAVDAILENGAPLARRNGNGHVRNGSTNDLDAARRLLGMLELVDDPSVPHGLAHRTIAAASELPSTAPAPLAAAGASPRPARQP